jgi:SAM-dependent methyltransferase
VRRHDIATDPLPEAAFDLVHARLVLGHLPEREKALGHMVAALNPRGWLLVEDFDALSIRPDPTVNPMEVSLKADFSMHHLMTERGVDLRYGRLLAGRLRRTWID